jgi:hypothetical protein
MESKVLLYDSNDVKIGETFVRRARSLVKQQRAMWLDEAQSAVKFFTGMENLPIAEDSQGSDVATADTKDDTLIVALVEKRIKERKMLMVHSFMLVPVMLAVYFVLVSYWAGWTGVVAFCIILSIWVMAYIVHVWSSVANKRHDYRLFGKKGIQTAEIAVLKNRLQK